MAENSNSNSNSNISSYIREDKSIINSNSNDNYKNNTRIPSNTDSTITNKNADTSANTNTNTNTNTNEDANVNVNANSKNNTNNDGNRNGNGKWMETSNTGIPNHAASKRIIIGGIPGVGKTSVISSAVESIRKKGQNARVVVFGTEMFEEAKRTAGIKNRDELRKLAVEDQRRLQDMTARRISEMQDSIVIVDTHIFIRTGEGYYYPGLPLHLLEIIKPTSFVIIVADALEIVNRRKKDTSRVRDDISTDQVQYEIDTSKLMVATCSILTGAPFIIVTNNDDKMEEAVSCVAKVLLSGST
ncbi:MAG TPA: adenylate kinase [Nitrososphaeraceae archaeon]|nr:adenylate kinase [Nitrososphaeraceae archaeon]